MKNLYAPDHLIADLQNKRTSAKYVYQYEEAKDEYVAAVREVEWMLPALQGILDIKATLYFAMSASKQPLQITKAATDTFVILLDRDVAYNLVTLCLRLQSKAPLCEFLGLSERKEATSYEGKYLLDVAKEMSFGPHDFLELLKNSESLAVYQAALLYMVAHEVAHAAHGHMDFMASAAFKDFAKDDEDRSLTLRALEMDADSSATSSVFDVYERVIKILPTPSGKFSGLSIGDFTKLLRRQYVAGVIIAHIFHDTLTTNFSPKNHPVGYARFLASVGVLEIIFSKHFPEGTSLPGEARKCIADTFVQLSGDLASLWHPIAANIMFLDDAGKPTHMYDEIGVAAGLTHLSMLHRRWSRVRPHLEPYLRGGVLAPAQDDPY